MEIKPELLRKLKQIEDQGCNCNAMDGYTCPIHIMVLNFKQELSSL